MDAHHPVGHRFDLRRAAFAKDDRILFTRDQGGNELNHLYVLKDGQERDLTPGDKLRPSSAGGRPMGRGYEASAVMPRSDVAMLCTTSARSRANGVEPAISVAICSSSSAAAAVPSIAAR